MTLIGIAFHLVRCIERPASMSVSCLPARGTSRRARQFLHLPGPAAWAAPYPERTMRAPASQPTPSLQKQQQAVSTLTSTTLRCMRASIRRRFRPTWPASRKNSGIRPAEQPDNPNSQQIEKPGSEQSGRINPQGMDPARTNTRLEEHDELAGKAGTDWKHPSGRARRPDGMAVPGSTGLSGEYCEQCGGSATGRGAKPRVPGKKLLQDSFQ